MSGSEALGWLARLHGMRLAIASRECISIIVEPAPATELAPLIVSAYGLTEREQEVARHALQGWPTKRIAEALGLSPYTVSDHLRRVFAKVGVHTRTDFASRIFFDHYWPRLAEADRPTPRSAVDAEDRGAEWTLIAADPRAETRAPPFEYRQSSPSPSPSTVGAEARAL
jgi:DNA-binding CsgD family transcriptional regulator